MEEPILKSVAMPPRFLWAPQVPAILNMAVQMAIAFITIGIFSINPLFNLISIVIVHLVLIAIGVREPHLSTMLQSQGPFARTYHSVYKKPGRKLAP